MNAALPSRRHFLQAGSLGMVAALASTTPGRCLGIEPVKRNGTAKFKFSLAAYSYRSVLQGNPAKLTMFDFVDDCARFGLEGTELTSYYFPKEVTPEYLRQLKQHCFLLGLDVSGTAVGNDFGFPPDDPKRKQQIDHVKSWVDHAEMLGAPVIRIFAGHPKPNQSAEETHALMVEGIQEACEYAGTHGVHLALENHGGPTSTAEGLLALVRDVKSPWFGVNLDTGNFHSNDVYAELEQAAPYAMNVQVKVVVSGPDKKKQPADFKRLAEILRASKYRGYIVLEYEESGNPRGECERYLEQLRNAFA